MKEITTKEEFRKAVENKTKEFVVVGDLAKDLKKVQVMKKVSNGALVALGTSIAAVPITGGLSAFAAVPAVGAISLETGFAIGIIFIFASLGASVIISTFNDYETEFSTDSSKKSGIKATYKRKKGN